MTNTQQAAALLFLTLLPMNAHSLTLDEAYGKALKTAESVTRTQVSVEIAEAEYRRRLSVLWPDLSLNVSEQIQDVPGTTTSSGSSIQSTFVRRSRPEVNLALNKTLFAGLREFAGVESAKASTRQAQAQKRRALQLIYSEVAEAFYGVIARQKEIEVVQIRQKVLVDRATQLQRFERNGRSRPSERLLVLAESKDVEADVEGLKAALSRSRALLEFWVQESAREPLVETSASLSPLPPLEECIQDTKNRPDLEAIRANVDVAIADMRVAKGDYWPTIDLQAKYYPYRVGYLSDIDWDLLLLLNYPFFQGGRTKAEVRKASLARRQLELDLSESERRAKLDVTNSYEELTALAARSRALKEATDLYEKNYSLQADEYRLGLVTNLDVLAALSQLYQTKRQAVTNEYLAKAQMAALSVARGKVPQP